MPRRTKGPRLWLRPARRDANGKLKHGSIWIILDRGVQHGTSYGASELPQAEKALAEYLAKKYTKEATSGPRGTSEISVADVLALYIQDVIPSQSRPADALRRNERLHAFFGKHTLADVNGHLCRDYARQCSTESMARRDLEDLRSAINHHRQEGLHDRIVSVVMPPRRPPRERWLTRSEAAALLWEAWRRPKCKHIAKFILVALYTGRRASVVVGASFQRETGRPWVDLDGAMLWPPERARVTNKRNPPIPLPVRLLSHLKLWHRSGQRYVVEWGGHAVGRMQKGMKKIAMDIGLGDDVTPHVLRHTAASWQMRAGTDMFEAGKFLGMTSRTLETVYAHHRPEHLTEARDAYSRLKRIRPTISNETREQNRKSVEKRPEKRPRSAR